MFPYRITYNYEYTKKLRVGFVGCGGQAFRNLLPTFQYAPVDLVATCDVDGSRAAAFARQFGASKSYEDYRRMIEKEDLDAVFFATGYDERGYPLYPVQAEFALRAGCHAWIEKPPAASTAEIEALQSVSRETKRQVAVGFMKMFSPSTRKVKEIINSPDFGSPTTFYLRDPEGLPPRGKRHDLLAMRYFLDHIVHPVSVIHTLMGPLKRLFLEEGPGGEPIFVMKFANGAAGILHMPWGIAGTSPKERLEVIGQGANVVVDNNTRITYYRSGHSDSEKLEYGRSGTFVGPDDDAPLHWEMDCYSGQPFNMHIFYVGYAFEVLYFCNRILEDLPIEIGGLEDAWHIIRFFEACQSIGDHPIDFSV